MQTPTEAITARRMRVNAALGGAYCHTVANSATGVKPGERGAGPQRKHGYRPVRTTHTRQFKPGRKGYNGGGNAGEGSR